MHSFNTYADAAAFAKQATKQQGVIARVKRDGSSFVVDVKHPEKFNHNDTVGVTSEEVQIEGKALIRWAESATTEDLRLLINSEYSDSEDIYAIHDAHHSGLSVSKKGSSHVVSRSLSLFKAGTFFFNSIEGQRISGKIFDALSPADKRIIECENYLRSQGFLVSELGGGASSLLLADAIRDFEINEVVPDNDTWNEIHNLLTSRPISTQKRGAKHVAKWIYHLENNNSDGFDVYRRVLLATLLRHSGQLEKSLEISQVVDLPRRRFIGNDVSVSILCTIRAATFMDMAEAQPSNRQHYLDQARLILNRANAMSGGNHPEIMTTYQRLASLEKLK